MNADTPDAGHDQAEQALRILTDELVHEQTSEHLRSALKIISIDEPRAAVVEIWSAAVASLRARREFPTDCTDQKLLTLAKQTGEISADECSLLNYNRQLRNECAHSGRTPTSAEFFAFFEEVGRTVWLPRDQEFTQARLAGHR